MELKEELLALLPKMGIKELNPMQVEAIKSVLNNAETLLLSKTGTGKTLAYLLPLLQSFNKSAQVVQAMVLVPSRELAIQIESVWKQLSTGFKVNACYGGHDMQIEIQNLSEAPDLLIGTPGRIADHIKRRTFDFDSIETLVFDEFDKSLALGFEEDMHAIVSSLPQVKKKVLVSATASIEIPEFVGLVNLKVLNYLDQTETNMQLALSLVLSEEKDKLNTLFNLLCFLKNGPTLIFCNHRDAVDRTASMLINLGIDAGAFHGGMEQMQREQMLIKFRNGSIPFLVATDLAARGLDIPDLKNIIHYHLPTTEAEFTHRNGRTARMENSGAAYLLMHMEEPLPFYLKEKPALFAIPKNLPIPNPSNWKTIYINGGKKDKLNKIDIVGFLIQKGGLQKEELGLLVVKDHNAFVAVKRQKLKSLLQLVQNEKIKGTKYRIVEAR